MSLVTQASELPLANSLLQEHIDYHNIVKIVVEVLKSEVPNYAQLKLDPSLTQYLLTIVKAKFPSGTDEQHAKVIMEVLQRAFCLSDEEMARVPPQIRFIIANGLSVIKKPKFWKRVRRFFSTKPKR